MDPTANPAEPTLDPDGLPPRLAELARDLERRWDERDRRLPGWIPLARRDGEVREILDGNVEAFERIRPRGSSTSMVQAQQQIVDAIQAMMESTGGQRSIVDLLLDAARGDGGPLRILDAAAGSGWLLRHLWHVARRRGVEVELTAGDLNPDFVASLRERFAADDLPIAARTGDARYMPAVDDGAWHVAFLSYTLHHLRPPDAGLCLRELDRVSAGGLVMVDVRRAASGVVFDQLMLRPYERRGEPWVRHDGWASVRRAYTVREIRLLLDWVGIGDRYRVGPLPTLHPQRLVAHAVRPV